MLGSEFLDVVDSCENCDEWSIIARDLCGSGHSIYNYKLVKELKDKGYVIESVDGYGGEDQGSDYWGVFSVAHNDEVTYFQIDGWYASYHGADIDHRDLLKVKKVPVQSYEWRQE